MDSKEKSISLPLVILFVLVAAAAFAALGYWEGKKTTETASEEAVPMPPVPVEPTESVTATASTTADVTADWKMYTNDTYGFSFKYPSDWTKEALANNTQVIVSSPDTKELVDAGKLHPGYANNLVVTYYPDINNENARGGSWEGQRTYTSLTDYFTDPKAPKQKIGETTVDGVKAYEVGISGLGGNYGIMIEKNSGVYELSFERRTKKSDLSNEENQILSTFQFTK